MNVALVDTTQPVVTVPASIVAEATSQTGATVSFSASAIDNIDGILSAACSPASATTFSLGTTTVTCNATDTRGNAGSASFTVTVRDTTPPVVSTGTDRVVEANGRSGSYVTYDVSASDAIDGPLLPAAINCAPAPGSLFGLGSLPVVCRATDSRGNTGTGGLTVTVVDTTAPTLSVPAPLRVSTTGAGVAAGSPSIAAFLGAAGAADIADPNPRVSNDAPAVFPLGTTTVTFTALDSSNNRVTRTSTVTVTTDAVAPSAQPDVVPPANVSGLSAQALNQSIQPALARTRGLRLCARRDPALDDHCRLGVHRRLPRARDDLPRPSPRKRDRVPVRLRQCRCRRESVVWRRRCRRAGPPASDGAGDRRSGSGATGPRVGRRRWRVVLQRAAVQEWAKSLQRMAEDESPQAGSYVGLRRSARAPRARDIPVVCVARLRRAARQPLRPTPRPGIIRGGSMTVGRRTRLLRLVVLGVFLLLPAGWASSLALAEEAPVPTVPVPTTVAPDPVPPPVATPRPDPAPTPRARPAPAPATPAPSRPRVFTPPQVTQRPVARPDAAQISEAKARATAKAKAKAVARAESEGEGEGTAKRGGTRGDPVRPGGSTVFASFASFAPRRDARARALDYGAGPVQRASLVRDGISGGPSDPGDRDRVGRGKPPPTAFDREHTEPDLSPCS